MELLKWYELMIRAGEFTNQRTRVSDEMRALCAGFEKWDAVRQRTIDDLKKRIHNLEHKGSAE